jgi:phosphoribosylamine--glycine ligase
MSSLKVILVGAGGREHAIGAALAGSEATLYVAAPTLNPGLAKIAKVFRKVEVENGDVIASWAKEVRADLAVLGPDASVAAGVADKLRDAQVPTVGPGASAGRIESSKAFARGMMEKYSVPGQPRCDEVRSPDEVERAIRSVGEPFVVKPSWLTFGKGVWVQGPDFTTAAEGSDYAKKLLSEGKGEPVVIEQKLEGEEFSLMAFVDGKSVLPMPVVRDYKRALEDDKGGNTGGMGSYSTRNFLLPFLTEDEYGQAVSMMEKTVAALNGEGLEYRGILYGGFMLTKDGPMILEYNARFGDPEALNVLSIFDGTDFADLMLGVARGSANPVHARFRRRATVVKYLCPPGYGSHPEKGGILDVDARAIEEMGVKIYFGSVTTGKNPGEVVMGTSRAIGLVGEGSALKDAYARVEEAIGLVKGTYMMRHDVASADNVKKQVDHIKTLRATPPRDPAANPTRSGPSSPPVFT